MIFSNRLIILLQCTFHSTHGFVENIILRSTQVPYTTKISKTSLRVVDIGYSVMESNPLQISQDYSIIGKFFQKCSSDPSLEAEVLNDMGHVLLDMFTFVTPEAALISRLLAVIGRLAFIASDYIPDHAIRPDELIFQVSMLLISSARFSKCLLPVAQSLLSPTSLREKRAYVLLFRHVGLPWNKYKYIVSNAFNWVDLSPNELIPEDALQQGKYLFWVYNGTVKAEELDGVVLNQFSRNSLIGFDQLKSPNTQLRTGVTGASLLKVDVEKLQQLMNEDGVLNDSVRNLLFKMLKQTLTLPKNVTAM